MRANCDWSQNMKWDGWLIPVFCTVSEPEIVLFDLQNNFMSKYGINNDIKVRSDKYRPVHESKKTSFLDK